MAPTSGNHPSDLFPFRGEFERLSISFITLGVGATEPFSVLHISDSHLTDVYPDESERKREISRIRTRQFGGKQREALEDSLAWAATHDDYVIHTGDIIDFQSRANFDHVKRLLGENVIGTVGNHEFSPEMWLSAIPEPEPFGNWLAQANDATTAAFIREVKGSPLVKAVLAGHLHFTMQDRLSSTATEYLVGGNYLFHAQEILFV